MTTSATVVALAAITLVLGAGGMARGEKVYGVDSNLDSLYTLDLETGAVIVIGALHSDPARYTTPISLAVRPSDYAIFVVNNSPPSDEGLSTVNSSTGEATYVGGGYLGSIAFDAADVLYGFSPNYELVTVDTSDGTTTNLGGPRVAEKSPDGLDFNPADGYLYALVSGASGSDPFDLLKIDPNDGSLDATVSLGSILGTGAPGGLLFDSNGNLWVTNNDATDNLHRVDPTSGAVLETLTAEEVPQGLGQIPEPASASLLALGGLALLRRRRST